MGVDDILSLLGGLALFLYGMNMMSSGLEVAAGDKMQMILEKLTANRFMGILVGALITAAMQSSSATTVMVVGFVNSGLMPLEKAVWIIMGANIGATLTGQLVALDISEIAPLFAVIGVAIIMFIKKDRWSSVGMVIGGLGILFMGMGMMSDATVPLRDSEAFVNMMTNFSNPLLGIAFGAIITAIIQSSGASLGMLQALANSGVVTLESSIYVLFGQNIGTCITSFLAALSGNRSAKRTTLVHFLFNIIGTIVFVIICQFLPFTDWIISLTPNSPMSQLANVHTIFNIVTTLMLIPFGEYLAKLTYVILPLKDDEKEDIVELSILSDRKFGTSAIALNSLRNEVLKMFVYTKKSLMLTYVAFESGTQVDWERIEKNENHINRINHDINAFMANVGTLGMNETDVEKCNALFKLSLDIERIGDHIENLAEYAKMYGEKKINFSAGALRDLDVLYKNVQYSQDLIMENDINEHKELVDVVCNKEDEMDALTEEFKTNQIIRLKEKRADADTSVVFTEMLTDLERISDYLRDIATDCYNYQLSFKVTE